MKFLFKTKTGTHVELRCRLMTHDIIDFTPAMEPEVYTPDDLTAHVHQLRRRSEGIWHWVAIAVLTGTLTALAFVNFFAR